VLGALALTRGSATARRLIFAGGLAYGSVPLLRARHRPRPLGVAFLIPAALALKDVSKAAGTLAEFVLPSSRR
jgi:hypothetical protein